MENGGAIEPLDRPLAIETIAFAPPARTAVIFSARAIGPDADRQGLNNAVLSLAHKPGK